MATHESAKKRARQSKKRAIRNRRIRSSMRSAIQEARKAIEEKNPEKAKSSLLMASKKIDKACSAGVLHWKTASRKVSRLAKLVNTLSAS